MRVEVEGRRNAAVAKALLDDVRLDAGRKQQRGARMPEAVDRDSADTGLLDQVSRIRTTVLALKGVPSVAPSPCRCSHACAKTSPWSS